MVFDVNARRNLTHPHKQCNSQSEKYKHIRLIGFVIRVSVEILYYVDEEALRIVLTNIRN